MIVMTRERRPVPAPGTTPFEEFVSGTAGALLRLATVMTADPSAAQDVVQSVLERAFRDWPRISGLEHRDAYVRRMITNEALSLRRRARRIVLTDAVPDSRLSPDETAGIGDNEELIAALRRLPPRQRVAVGLRYFADLSDADIAAALGCREGTVRGYVLRGLRRLRIDFDADGGAPARGRPTPSVTSQQEDDR